MTAFLAANGPSADSTAAAGLFVGFGNSVAASVAGVMTGFNSAHQALTAALVADVAAADQPETDAAQVQTTVITIATGNAPHQFGHAVQSEHKRMIPAMPNGMRENNGLLPPARTPLA